MLKKRLTYCIAPAIIGLAFYIFFHKPNLLLHTFINDLVEFPNYYNRIKDTTLGILFLNYFADILWCFSLTNFLLFFCFKKYNYTTKAALIIIVVSLTEVVQLFFSKQFTFDWVDSVLSILIPFAIIKNKKNNHETSL